MELPRRCPDVVVLADGKGYFGRLDSCAAQGETGLVNLLEGSYTASVRCSNAAMRRTKATLRIMRLWPTKTKFVRRRSPHEPRCEF